MLNISSKKDKVIHSEALGVLCWILKDFSWCLLFGFLSFPMALAAIYLETTSLCAAWPNASPGGRVHRVALVLWLFANATWMVGELCFSPSPELGRHYPWYHGPYAGPNKAVYESFVLMAQAIFVSALVMLLAFYGWSAFRIGEKEDDVPTIGADKLVFGKISPDVYCLLFIGPWITKDIFWTLDMIWPGLFFGFIVMALVIDYFRRYGGVEFLAELCWVVGNTVWICSEEIGDDASHAPRLVAAASLFVGAVITVYGILNQSDSQDPNESTVLVDKGYK